MGVTRNLQDNRRTVHHFKERIEDNIKNNIKKERYITPEMQIKKAKLRYPEMVDEHSEKYTNLKSDDHMNQEDKEVQNDNVINEKTGLETVPIKAEAKKKKLKEKRL